MSVPAEVKGAYRDVLRFFIDIGRAPHFTELSARLGVSAGRALELQRAAAEAGVGTWFLADTDFVECWAPFSSIPTNHLITIDGEQRWFGQCGLEALAVTWVTPGSEVRVDSFCLDCGEAVTVVQHGGELIDVHPDTAVGHTNESFSRFDWDERKNFI